MRIIPAIDIIGGKCVRLTRGDYSSKKIYNEDPLEAAKAFEDAGLRFLHLVDLDGAKDKKIINNKILERISSKTSLAIDFGGGIRSDDDIRIAFSSGATQVIGGSVAVSDPSVFLDWLNRYGNKKVILGADCINRKIATNAWEEESGWDVIDFISEFSSRGVIYSVCTDIDKDGMMMGPATLLYREILERVRLNLIASGGIVSVKDIEDVREAGCEGVIIGKAVYEGKIKLKDLKDLC
jgi:phosphoribosylformimino-5-aminoimidazole carboxamide ribotide isomerase